MVEYRYYTVDLPTGNVVAELPLYGVYMDKQLSDTGNFTGTYRLGIDYTLDQIAIDGSIPGKHGIACRRDGLLVWAGAIWSRTYASDASTVQLSAQTFESLFSHIMVVNDQNFVATEQVDILNNFLVSINNQLSGAMNYNFGLNPIPAATGVARTIQMWANQNRLASDFISMLSDLDNGLAINVNPVTSIDRVLKEVGAHLNSSPPSSGMVFDYPGTITQYWFTEGPSTSRHVAIGAGPLRASADSAGLTGWPLMHSVRRYSEIQDQTILQARANQDAIRYKPPIPSPIFELGTRSLFSGWNDLGKTLVAQIRDNRFPTGKTLTSRLKAWSLNPESSEEAEVIRLEFMDGF